MQRVAWNDALDVFHGAVKRTSSASSCASGIEDESCEVLDFHHDRVMGPMPSDSGHHGGKQQRGSGMSAMTNMSQKSLGRMAAKAYWKRQKSHGKVMTHGIPFFDSIDESTTLAEILQAQMTAIQQVLAESHEKLRQLEQENEEKINDLRAENKFLRTHCGDNVKGGVKFHQKMSKTAPHSKRNSAANSLAPSAAASVAPSARNSIHSNINPLEVSNSFTARRSHGNYIRCASIDSAPVVQCSSVESEKVSTTLCENNVMVFKSAATVTPPPPPSRGLNGCVNLELEDYEEGQPESFNLNDNLRISQETDGQDGQTITEDTLVQHMKSKDSQEFLAEEEQDRFPDDISSNSSVGDVMFDVLPIWTSKANGMMPVKKSPTKTFSSNKEKNFMRISKLRDLTFKFTDVLAEENKTTALCGQLERLVLHPSSLWRAIWDLMSIFLVAYDLVVIPLALFEPEETAVLTVTAWVCRIFWTIDMPLTFFTGFIRNDGSLEMRPPKIARRYLTTWFSLDFFLVAIDWLETSWSDGLAYARLGKSSRIFRVLRLVRLLRMLRMKDVIQVFMERMHSERLWIFSDILKIMFLVVGMAHIIACLWYGIGNTENQANSWVEQYLEKPGIYSDLGARYAMSLHWSLSQFTGGMDEMKPETVSERVFAIIIYIFTFIVAAVFVSSLTSSMTRLHFIASHQSKQFFQLRRYLYQNNISDELTLRIQRNAQHAVTESQLFMQEGSVDLLDMVSEPLRIDLHFELYSPIYHLHPFFDTYSETCPQVMRKVCHRATSMTLASCGDTIFDAGEIPAHPKMIFMCSGEMQYVSIGGTETQVKAVMWISEAVLWTSWMHLGVLTATTECRLVVLDSQKFHHIVAQYDHADMDPRKYAQQFVQRLNETTDEITDLPLTDMNIIRNNSRIKNRRLTIQLSKFTG